MLLHLFFKCHKAPRLIFLEEDLEVAPDFFQLFAATAPLLERDKSLLCVSAWNDHGQHGRANNLTALYRTDIMPGLGWMLTASTGFELLTNWPVMYWDDWLRKPEIRKGRQCIFPEVPRTHTFGEVGTSGGQFYNEHLRDMMVSDQRVNWTLQDLSYLEEKNYALLMSHWLAAAKKLSDPSQRWSSEGFLQRDSCSPLQWPSNLPNSSRAQEHLMEVDLKFVCPSSLAFAQRRTACGTWDQVPGSSATS